MAEELSEVQKHHRALLEKLRKFLPKESPPDVLIIKSHLICEYYLTQILILRGVCSHRELRDFTFREKLEKALKKNNPVEKESYEEIQKLNRLRNKIGHELEYSLSEADIDELGFPRGKEYIFNKYDFEALPELLRDTLRNIVIGISFIVFTLVDEHKKSALKPIPVQEKESADTSK